MIARGRTISLAAALALPALLSAACSSRPPAIPVTPAASPQERAAADPVPAPAPAPTELTSAKLSVDGDVVVLTLGGTGPLSPKVFTREDGRRVVLDFPGAFLAPGLEPPRFPEGAPSTVSSVEARTVSELGQAHVQIEIESDVAIDAKLPLAAGSLATTVTLSLVPRSPAKAAASVSAPPVAAPAPALPAKPAAAAAAPIPATARPATTPRPRPTPTPTPAVTRAPAPPARPARVADCPSPDWKGKEPVFIVHFSSYQDRGTAEKDAVRVAKALGKPAHAVSVDLGARGTWYRVVAGDFPTWEEATAWRADLAAKATPNLGLVYRLTGR